MMRRPASRRGRSTRWFVLPLTLALVASTLGVAGSAPRAGILFSDGFEGGNLNLWTAKTGTVAQQQEVYAGAWAARATSTGSPAYVASTLNPAASDLYVDMRFKVLSQGNMNVALVRFRTSATGAIFSIMRRNDGRLLYYNEVTGASTASATSISVGVWHELEVHGLINGTSSTEEVWYDGVRMADVSKTDNLGSTAMGKIYLGDPGSGKTWDIAFDAAVFSSTFDVAAPTVPASVSATAPAPTQVDLTWSAASDNVGVAGYTVYRDGTALGSTGGSTTSYSDTSVSPSMTYSYTVDAYDAGGNRSAQSAPSSVTTPGVPDSMPPSVPQNLAATAAAPNQVNLGWSPSSDNVGVAGYTIYRGGSLLATVGPTVAYSDTTVGPNQTYSYSVDAFDAAGNHSDPSAAVTVTTPGLLFSDGFETGNLNLWSARAGITAQQQQVYSGMWGARATSTGSAAYAYTSMVPTQTEVYADQYFKVLSQGNMNVALVRFRTSSAGAIFSILRRNDGKLHYYNEVTGAGISSSTVITTGAWHHLEVHLLINGTAGQAEVWLDGSRLSDVSRTDNFGTTPIGRVYIGDPGTGKTWDIAFDQVVVSTAADVTPPTVPSGVTATPVGPTHVNVTWTPSTDATGIAGYTIYRNGAAVGTMGGAATQYADFAAPAGSTSSYTVAALDPAGNRSAQSAPATAATAAATGGDPVVLAVGDIACDPNNPLYNAGAGTSTDCRQRYTSDMAFNANPSAVLALGDLQYEDAVLSKFQSVYDPTWGRVRSITYPLPGNHEYLTGGAGYFAYFGAAAGDPTKGYYSFDLGSWHIIMLNDACSALGGCDSNSPEGKWLAADLASHPSTCTLAAWHTPAFSSGYHGNEPLLAATFWNQLYAAGVDVVLNGHDHNYERFASQNPTQQPDPNGIRAFTVGTGGDEHEPLSTVQPNSEALNNDTYGLLQLTLHPAGYDFSFLPEPGSGTFADSGSGSCH